MSQTIYYGTQGNWYVNGPPDSVTILCCGQTLNVNDIVLDTSTNIEYRITALGIYDSSTETWTGTAFKQAVFDANILATLNSQGWNVNTSRSYANAGIGFSSVRSPSSTNDVMVVASISLTSTLLTAATVQFQVAGSVMTEVSLGGLAATATQTATFIVPAGSSYELVNTSGTAAITYLKEVSL